VKTRLHRWLGAAALGGGLFFLWAGTASAEPDVNISGATIDGDDVLGAPEPTTDPTLPVAAEALLGTNDVVVGDPDDAPVVAEVVSTDLPDPTVVTPPAAADTTVADSTADVVAPVATVDPDVVVCGNAAGVVGDAAAECDPGADDGTTGTTAEPGSFDAALGDSSPLPGTTFDGELPEVVADPDVLACGNAVGIVGDASGSCAPDAEPAPVADAGSLDLVLGGGTPVSGTELDSELPGVVADPDAVTCGNGAGVIGDASGGCTPAMTATPVAEAGSFDLALGGTTPVSGSTASGELPGAVVAPDAMACGNGAGIVGDGSGSCTPAASDEPLTPIDTFGLDLELAGTTPLDGSSAEVDLSSTAIDPNADVCGNGVGALGDGSGTCGDTGSAVPAVPVDPAAAVEVAPEPGALDPAPPVLPELPAIPGGLEAPEVPALPALPIDPLGDLVPLPEVPVLPSPEGDDGDPIEIGPIEVGGLGGTTTPVDPPAPAPSPEPTPVPTRPGLGVDGSLTPIGGGGAFGSIVPLGTAAGAGAADLSATGFGGDALARMAAALAFTGFGIRSALSLASVLLALGALLLLVGRRRVELVATLS
jgi:hypothetical protein